MRLRPFRRFFNAPMPTASTSNASAPLFAFGVALLLLMGGIAGCGPVAQSVNRPADEALARRAGIAVAAYTVYEKRGCHAVQYEAPISEVRKWPAGEIKYSTRLLHGFCAELEGDIESARAIYRTIARDAPLSFASEDAEYRLRILRLLERDSEYADWVADAKRRSSIAETDSYKRPPIERPLARYPPIAREAKIDGFAVVEFGVTPRGETDAPVVVDSNPPLIFDGAAVRAVREWQYMKKPESETSERQIIRILFKSDSETPTGSGS